MNNGHFYYIKDDYFLDFPDKMLMKNKENLEDELHDRPCFYAFKDDDSEIYWMIPFSSKVDKYQIYYDKKLKKYNKCDTIVFGEVLGHKKAFLVQNMCPITEKYIKNEYIDAASNLPVRINGVLEKELISKAKRVLLLQRNGIKLIFPDVLKIEAKLLETNSI